MKPVVTRGMVLIWIVMIVLFSLLPFAWIVLTAFKTPLEIDAIPPTIFPSTFSFEFFRIALFEKGLLKYVKNSVMVAGLTTLISLFFSSMGGYALSRLKIKGKNLLLLLILACSMFPQLSIVGPVWLILRDLGLLNTVWGLVIPYTAFSLPFGIWICTVFFNQIPKELEEAALVDGCPRWKVLYKIILPLAAPGIFTAAILVFIGSWNEFFFALVINTAPHAQTLPVGIALFPGQYTMPWGEISAACVIATLPLVVLVLTFQKQIISGLSQGAIKG